MKVKLAGAPVTFHRGSTPLESNISCCAAGAATTKPDAVRAGRVGRMTVFTFHMAAGNTKTAASIFRPAVNVDRTGNTMREESRGCVRLGCKDQAGH